MNSICGIYSKILSASSKRKEFKKKKDICHWEHVQIFIVLPHLIQLSNYQTVFFFFFLDMKS